MTVKYIITDGTIIGQPGTAASVSAIPTGVPLGTVLSGIDATYGDGEFMFVAFTGTVAAGDFVVIDRAAKTAVQASQSTIKGSIAIAMAAQSAGTYGFVMLRGVHDGANVATGVTAGTALGVSTTAGRAASTSATFKIDGAFERVSTSLGNVGVVDINWASWSGNG